MRGEPGLREGEARLHDRETGRDARDREARGFADDESEDLRRPGADGAQHGHLAAALGQTGEQRDEHPGESDDDGHDRHGTQRLLGDGDEAPEFGERRPREDRGERLRRERVHGPLHRQCRGARAQAHEDRGDRAIRVARGGRRVGGVQCGGKRIDFGRGADRCVQRVDRIEAHVDRPVDGCAGRGKDAAHPERLVGVQREAHVAGAVREHESGSDGVPERPRDLGAEHGLVRTRERTALRDDELPVVAVAVVREVRVGRAEHAIAAVRIAERQRDRPRDRGLVGDRAIARPAQAAGGFADPEDGREQQVHGARARADDEIGAGDRRGEALAGFLAQPLDAEQQAHRQRDRQHRQRDGEGAVTQAAEGEREDHVGRWSGAVRPAASPRTTSA